MYLLLLLLLLLLWPLLLHRHPRLIGRNRN